MIQVYHKAYASIFNLVMYTLVDYASWPLFLSIWDNKPSVHILNWLLRPFFWGLISSQFSLVLYYNASTGKQWDSHHPFRCCVIALCDTFCIKGHSCDPWLRARHFRRYLLSSIKAVTQMSTWVFIWTESRLERVLKMGKPGFELSGQLE